MPQRALDESLAVSLATSPLPAPGKARHLRGGGPLWTNWGFVISPYNRGTHDLLAKGL